MQTGRNNSELRVLHVITTLRTGGAERMLTSLLLAKPQRAMTTHVACLMPGGYFLNRLRHDGIPITELDLVRSLDAPKAVLRLAQLIRSYQPHVVQSWLYHADMIATLALTLSCRRSKTKLFWGVRSSNMELSHYGWPLRVSVAACVRLSSAPDAIVANSENGRDCHRRIGYHPKRFCVIPNGIDTDCFRPDSAIRKRIRAEFGFPERTPVLAMVARVDPKKDHACFLSALARLPGIQAFVVGKGTEGLPDLPGLHRLGLRDDVPDVLAASDLVVSSSAFGEGFPNTIAEGMACELPPVATDVGDAARVVGQSGITVPPGDPGALAAAIRALVDEMPEERFERGRQARKRIQELFSVEKAVTAFERLYHGEAVES